MKRYTRMVFPSFVRLVEVSPRDGLQNQSRRLTTPEKINFINTLSGTGLQTIETTAFVSPRRVPQLADHVEVYVGIDKKQGVSYPVLVPNLQGLEGALEAGVQDIAVFIAATETFSEKNTHCSIADSLRRVSDIMSVAKDNHITVRGYLSCVAGCPYEGKVPLDRVVSLADSLFRLGCEEISLGDTIGVGTPFQIRELLRAIARKIPLNQIAVHFHDTYGQALANILMALQTGVHVIDGSVAGLGGCPYAKGATGNVATEDVLYMLNGLGIETGVNLESLIQAGKAVCSLLNQSVASKVSKAYAAMHVS